MARDFHFGLLSQQETTTLVAKEIIFLYNAGLVRG